MADTSAPQESSKLPQPKWIAKATAGTLALIVVALLQRYGDAVFDTLQSALGKRLLVQSIGLLLVLLGYSGWVVFRKPRIRQLHRRRAIYWVHGDSTPFCAFCYETTSKQHHLIGPIHIMDRSIERWDCPVCHHDYTAKSGDDFLMRSMR